MADRLRRSTRTHHARADTGRRWRRRCVAATIDLYCRRAAGGCRGRSSASAGYLPRPRDSFSSSTFTSTGFGK
ncbi:hypothetical protein A8H40_09660 [Burkholderia multivorans]|nr:hypothetical protein A8H40_09660 [Burkholderia multivorans]PRE29256.1 hypothetical protein C6P92_01895 [Burkholderia multivorans]PRF97898.1 hypothetical protein C6Q22_00210 [Burkholderia multivorans]PRG66610.1 hypothetical protein C6T69_20090 [Burkholderia multivorans]PRG94050.1 hypothetical protein C6V04_12350 [Burkholderia multivorans]